MALVETFEDSVLVKIVHPAPEGQACRVGMAAEQLLLNVFVEDIELVEDGVGSSYAFHPFDGVPEIGAVMDIGSYNFV